MTLEQKLTPEIKAKLEARERARTDKIWLATEVLNYDFCEDVHKELFEAYIQFDASKPYQFQSEHKKRLVLHSRGHYKTTSIVVEIIQTILNFPDVALVLMQGSLGTSKERLWEVASHFTGDAAGSKLAELFPEFCGDKKALKFSSERFTTPARKNKQSPMPTLSVASPKALKTGRHFDAGFFDDLIHEHNYRNPKLLKKAEEEFNAYIPLINPGGYFYVTGTRYTFGDLYENIMRNDVGIGEWIISLKTCWLEDSKTPRFPQRTTDKGKVIGFTTDMLLNIQRTDPGMFASQYLLQPVATGQQLFTELMLMEACIAPDKMPALGRPVLFMDCAASESAWSDDSVIIAGRADNNGCVYVTDVDGGAWMPDTFAQHVIAMTLKHRPAKILVEKSQSGLYMESMLRMAAKQHGIFLPIEFVAIKNVKDAKQIRISSLRTYLTNRRLKFAVGLPNWAKLVKQFIEFPRSNHDDYPDTVALMVMDFSKNGVFTASPFGRTLTIMDAIKQQAENDMASHVLNEGREFIDHSGGCGNDFAS